MMRRFGVLAAVGALLLTGNQIARADDDTYRLGGKVGDSTTTKLAWDGQDATVLTHGYRGGFGHGGYGGGYRVGFGYGGYRGGHVGYYGGYRGGYYGGYGGYYRPYVSVGVNYYRGYYGGYGYGYGGYGYTSYCAPTYYATSYYVAPVYYSQPCYTYPISSGYSTGGVQTYQPMIVNPAPQQQQLQQPMPQQQQPYTPMKPSDGTYPYDGGPGNPVPVPKDLTVPAYQPAPKLVPANDGRYVSLPSGQPKATSGGFAYPAYGEPQATTFASDRVAVSTTTAKKQK